MAEPVKIDWQVILDTQAAEKRAEGLRKTIAEELRKGSAEGAKLSEKEIARFAESIARDMERAGDQGGKRLGEKLGDHLLDLQGKFKEVFTKELPGLVGDMGDAVEMLGKNFGLLNKEAAESLGNAAGLMEKFGQLGATLGGPFGAAAGVAVGGLIALRTEMVESEKAALKLRFALVAVGQKALADLPKFLEEQKKQQAEMEKAWAGMTSAGGLARREGLSDGAKKLAEDFGFLEKRTTGVGKAARETAADLKRLNAELSASSRALSDNLQTTLGAMGAANEGRDSAIGAQTAAIAAQAKTWNDASRAIADYTAAWGTLHVQARMVGGELTAIGEDIAQALGGGVSTGFGILFDNIAAGKSAFDGLRKGMAAWVKDFSKMTGTKLILDGIANTLMGIASAPFGGHLIATGALEIGTGLAMGGAGALIARRAGVGGGEDGAGGLGAGSGASGSTGFGAARDPGPTTLPTVNVTFQSTVPPTFEEQVQIGRTLQGLLGAADQGGPQLQGRP
jgi:hypothetical protein